MDILQSDRELPTGSKVLKFVDGRLRFLVEASEATILSTRIKLALNRQWSAVGKSGDYVNGTLCENELDFSDRSA